MRPGEVAAGVVLVVIVGGYMVTCAYFAAGGVL